jgi:tetratricopeptide (TPR) repeat protein
VWSQYAVGNLGRIAYERGDYQTAKLRFEEAVALARAASNRVGVADWLIQQATVALDLGELVAARDFLRENLRLCQEIGYRSEMGHNFLVLAGLAIAQGQPERAARMLGAADPIRAQYYDYMEPAINTLRNRFGTLLETQMGQEAFAAALAWGHSLALNDAVAYALDLLRI